VEAVDYCDCGVLLVLDEARKQVQEGWRGWYLPA
jgi:hypothetical protein